MIDENAESPTPPEATSAAAPPSTTTTDNTTLDGKKKNIFENIVAAQEGSGSRSLDSIYDIPVRISAVLGNATLPVSQLLKLGRGAIVELDRRVGQSVDIYVNDRLIARGEVIVMDDRLGITMTEILKTDLA